MGGGGGRGMGRRCGMDASTGSVVRTPLQTAAVVEEDVARLKQEAEQLRQQLRETEQRLRHIEGGNP